MKYEVEVRDDANDDRWTEMVDAESGEEAVQKVHNQYSGHSHSTRLIGEAICPVDASHTERERKRIARNQR